jgi:hypothetical protein
MEGGLGAGLRYLLLPSTEQINKHWKDAAAKETVS